MNVELVEASELPTLEEFKRMVIDRPASIKLRQIAAHAECSTSWLKQVLNGDIQNPSYDKVRIIIAFLKSKRV